VTGTPITITIAEPTPVLAVTIRAGVDDRGKVVDDAVAALRETARRLALADAGPPARVLHDDAEVIEVCLPIAALPADDPPAPIAAEVLVPGTTVTSLA
jgi:hypothetical protein